MKLRLLTLLTVFCLAAPAFADESGVGQVNADNFAEMCCGGDIAGNLAQCSEAELLAKVAAQQGVSLGDAGTTTRGE